MRASGSARLSRNLDSALAAPQSDLKAKKMHDSRPGDQSLKGVGRLRVLVFAYACAPGFGSEQGVGWSLVRTVGEFADCVVLVIPEHGEGLAKWKAEHSASWLSYVVVPEPPFASRIKWHRITRFLIYLLWLRTARKIGRRLHVEQPFDGTYHATYAVYWLPTPATNFGVPCVWGPVGGAVSTPLRLWPLLGWSGIFDEILDLIAVRVASWWPGTRRVWRAAEGRIFNNEETLRRMPRSIRDRCGILNHVLFAAIPRVEDKPREPHLLAVAPLETRKGLRLLIRAMARTPGDIRLLIVGDGPDRAALGRLTRMLRVSHRVEFLGHVPRDKLFELYAGTAAVVFTGLREEGGMALAEAMLCGAPVIVLANGGARTVAESTTDPDRVALIEPAGMQETIHRLAQAMLRFSRKPSASTGPTLDPDAARRAFRGIFERALASSR